MLKLRTLKKPGLSLNSSVSNFQNLNLTLRPRENNKRTKLFILKSQCDVFFFSLAAPEPIMNFNWFETCLFVFELRRTTWKLLLYLQSYLDFRSYFETTGLNYFTVFCKILLQSIFPARIISWSPKRAQKQWKPKKFTASQPEWH